MEDIGQQCMFAKELERVLAELHDGVGTSLVRILPAPQ
jgi:hypothetical protein